MKKTELRPRFSFGASGSVLPDVAIPGGCGLHPNAPAALRAANLNGTSAFRTCHGSRDRDHSGRKIGRKSAFVSEEGPFHDHARDSFPAGWPGPPDVHRREVGGGPLRTNPRDMQPRNR